MHELLRQYAAEKLNESPNASEAAHDRHSTYFAAALQRWEADLKGPQQQTALAEMDVEIENARMAWHWAVKRGSVERSVQALGSLCSFYWRRRRYQEARAACQMTAERLATIVSQPPTTSGDVHVPSVAEGLRNWAKVLSWQSSFSGTERPGRLLQQSLSLLERPELADQDTQPEKAFVLLQMGHRMVDFDREEARHLWEQSLALYQALGDRWMTANVLDNLGLIAWHFGDWGEAKRLYEESLAIRQSLGDQ